MTNNRQNTTTIILSVGMIILLVTAVMPIIGMSFSWVKYVYACGAVMTLLARVFDRYTGKNTAIKRLYRIQAVSSVCYCVSAATLCVPLGGYVSEKDWIAFLMAGAVMQIYSSWRLQSEEKKEKEQ